MSVNNEESRRELFIKVYLETLDAKTAAILAGYNINKALEHGINLLERPIISRIVDAELAKEYKRSGMNRSRLLRLLGRIALLDPTNVVDEKGNIRSDASVDDLMCIQSIEYEDTPHGTRKKVTFADKTKALELLAEMIG